MSRGRHEDILLDSPLRYISPKSLDHPLVCDLKRQLATEKERADYAEAELEEFKRLMNMRISIDNTTICIKNDDITKLKRENAKLKEAIKHTISQYNQFDSKEVYSKVMDDYLKNVLDVLYPTDNKKKA